VGGFTLRAMAGELWRGNNQFAFDQIGSTLESLPTGQQLNLEILFGALPQYVVDGSATTWVDSDGRTQPVPWDPFARQESAEFYQALANHQVPNTTTPDPNDTIRLADHPALTIMSAGAVGVPRGIREIGQREFTTLLSLAGNNQNTLINGIIGSVTDARNAFPNKFGFIEYFGNVSVASLGTALINAFRANFNGTGLPSEGYFQENLSDVFPGATSGQGTTFLNLTAGGDGYTMFQALTSWTQPFGQGGPPTEQRKLSVASGTPVTGIAHGYNTFGTRYFEIYVADIDNAPAPTNRVYLGNGVYGDLVQPFDDDLLLWNEFLVGNFAKPDSATVNVNSGATAISVLGNELIPPGATVSFTIIGVTQAANGSVVITGNGSGLTYQPQANFFGMDTFTYAVSDGKGASSTATVTVTVNAGGTTPTPTPTPTPTATLSGTVTTPNGLGLRNATVTLTDSQGVRRPATTSSFGIYSFENIVTGQSYTISVSSRRYRFAPLIMMINGNLNNVDFVGLE
ncbi:MAG: Ig-like domain-containing protein, partial [Pyrinomonadaceae bacterium]